MKITTIKMDIMTKERVDKLRSYPKESYDKIIQKILEILNDCRLNPEKARTKLLKIDNSRKVNLLK